MHIEPSWWYTQISALQKIQASCFFPVPYFYATYNKWDLTPAICIILSYFTLLRRHLQDSTSHAKGSTSIIDKGEHWHFGDWREQSWNRELHRMSIWGCTTYCQHRPSDASEEAWDALPLKIEEDWIRI